MNQEETRVFQLPTKKTSSWQRVLTIIMTLGCLIYAASIVHHWLQ